MLGRPPASRNGLDFYQVPMKVNLSEKFSSFSGPWRPKIVATVNGQDVKLVKAKGEFVWHRHDEADELFLVWRGRLRLEFRGRTIDLEEGELGVAPRGLEHRTVADEEADVLIFEPVGTRNTGNVTDPNFTAPAEKIWRCPPRRRPGSTGRDV